MNHNIFMDEEQNIFMKDDKKNYTIFMEDEEYNHNIFMDDEQNIFMEDE